MNLRAVSLLGFALLFTIAATRPHDSPFKRGAAADRALSPEIEAQLETVARLARSKLSSKAADPRLFSALLRLEEMLPRSTATRKAQERGKRAFIAMIRSKRVRQAETWPSLRESIERDMRRDAVYMRAVAEVDRRLLADTGAFAAARIPVRKAASLPYGEMRPGDIMVWDDRSGPPLVRLAISMYASRVTHSAIYLGETRKPGHAAVRWVLEAQSPVLGVRKAIMGRKWIRKGLHVSLGHVKGISASAAAGIARTGLETYGGDGRTPYHIWPPWDKTDIRDGLYCSQLVWAAYDKRGVDLDSNDWHYLAWFTVHNWFNPYAASIAYQGVFPDEIRASPEIAWYYDQQNK